MYADAVLGALERHDSEGHGELVRSLEALLQNGEHWARAAADLGVHRNTLRYRIRRVEELSGRQLSSQDRGAVGWKGLSSPLESSTPHDARGSRLRFPRRGRATRYRAGAVPRP
jgi:PucR-like helix-turn-helix protein